MTSETEHAGVGVIGPRAALGIGLMIFGVCLGLDHLGLLDARAALRFWPLLLVAVGLVKLLAPDSQSDRTWNGLSWVVVGVMLQLSLLHVITLWRVWPVFLILAGARLVAQTAHAAARGAAQGDEPARIETFAVLGGFERALRSRDFRGGSLGTLMASYDLDLRDCSIENGPAQLDVTAICGGVKLRVPEDWVVESRGLALMGGFVDKSRAPFDDSKRLVVTGLALMGGVVVRN